mmetsp:Transcript_28688/g.65551  ORF Transcript_28688/g.65551 Transcript_28688/m.65551 type:complete len:904 (-) Transcript_28688:381-3092(-)
MATKIRINPRNIGDAISRWSWDRPLVELKYGNPSGWKTSKIKTMSQLLFYEAYFNEDLSSWDTSQVTTFAGMFHYAEQFNSDIGSWDTAQTTDMSYMFCTALKFNQDLDSWDMSRVQSMKFMFAKASSFNSPIGHWDLRAAKDLDHMFSSAVSFNQDLNSWNVVKTNIYGMFDSADSFNGGISAWDISGSLNLGPIFYSSSKFNREVSAWDTSSIINMSWMFCGAAAFNTDISYWDTSRTMFMNWMFAYTGAFNIDLSRWDISGVKDFSRMFKNATGFNQDICWKQNITEIEIFENTGGKFKCFTTTPIVARDFDNPAKRTFVYKKQAVPIGIILSGAITLTLGLMFLFFTATKLGCKSKVLTQLMHAEDNRGHINYSKEQVHDTSGTDSELNLSNHDKSKKGRNNERKNNSQIENGTELERNDQPKIKNYFLDTKSSHAIVLGSSFDTNMSNHQNNTCKNYDSSKAKISHKIIVPKSTSVSRVKEGLSETNSPNLETNQPSLSSDSEESLVVQKDFSDSSSGKKEFSDDSAADSSGQSNSTEHLVQRIFSEGFDTIRSRKLATVEEEGRLYLQKKKNQELLDRKDYKKTKSLDFHPLIEEFGLKCEAYKQVEHRQDSELHDRSVGVNRAPSDELICHGVKSAVCTTSSGFSDETVLIQNKKDSTCVPQCGALLNMSPSFTNTKSALDSIELHKHRSTSLLRSTSLIKNKNLDCIMPAGSGTESITSEVTPVIHNPVVWLEKDIPNTTCTTFEDKKNYVNCTAECHIVPNMLPPQNPLRVPNNKSKSSFVVEHGITNIITRNRYDSERRERDKNQLTPVQARVRLLSKYRNQSDSRKQTTKAVTKKKPKRYTELEYGHNILCSMCFENFREGEEIVTSKSGYHYHKECIEGWRKKVEVESYIG